MLKFYSLAFWDTLYIPHSASTSNLLFIHSSILWNLLLQHHVPSKEHVGGGVSVVLQVLWRQQAVLLVSRGSCGLIWRGRGGPQRQAQQPAAAQVRGADAQRQGGRGERGAGGIWGLQQLQGMILYRIGGRRIHSNNQFICEGCHLPCGCGRRDGED